jgi:hypothetical protein
MPSSHIRKCNQFKDALINLPQNCLSANLFHFPEAPVNVESIDLFMPEKVTSGGKCQLQEWSLNPVPHKITLLKREIMRHHLLALILFPINAKYTLISSLYKMLQDVRQQCQ